MSGSCSSRQPRTVGSHIPSLEVEAGHSPRLSSGAQYTGKPVSLNVSICSVRCAGHRSMALRGFSKQSLKSDHSEGHPVQCAWVLSMCRFRCSLDWLVCLLWDPSRIQKQTDGHVRMRCRSCHRALHTPETRTATAVSHPYTSVKELILDYF